ncbi:hypothetical protein [Rudaeicoccus suwonensis]|uniref:Uncharacterized protein n=1 Tax=Rudaeicoccus suwonensis TaxID=657409 RepID=A0A561EAG1_9MICO|nr:hypothetical protein [Rudaeicoccus suwonensis]TWE12589.1 hypothetical protein BKA23_1403 [Rudaeicoccus suwonensis]
MVEHQEKRRELEREHESVLLAATGRSDLIDALHWIAEGRSLLDVDSSSILVAVVAAADSGIQGADSALRTAVRSALRSSVDTSADLVLTDSIVPPHRYQAALANLARRTPSGTLSDITSATVMAAQAGDPQVIETLGLVAGLSWRDLQSRSQARGVPLPGDSHGVWNPSQVLGAFRVIDDVVRAQVKPQLAGAVAARPLELLLDGASGWDAIEKLRAEGVSYGTLLAQRDVGSGWSAHRNRSNNEISRLMVRRVLGALYDHRVDYWSTEGSEPVARAFLGEQAGVSGKPPGQLSVVTRRRDDTAGLAVLVAIARDGGTARKTAATLLQLPQKISMPAVLVLFGTGWADRGESDDLVRAYGGRIYTERTLDALASLAASVGVD